VLLHPSVIETFFLPSGPSWVHWRGSRARRRDFV